MAQGFIAGRPFSQPGKQNTCCGERGVKGGQGEGEALRGRGEEKKKREDAVAKNDGFWRQWWVN